MIAAPDERTFRQQLAQLVREQRETARISQARLEIEAGLPGATIAQLERGEIDLAVYELARVASVLGVETASLIPSVPATS